MLNEAPTPVYVLNVQRGFRCRHAGACCTFGWHIPIETSTSALVAEAVRSGRILLPGRGPGARDDDWLDAQQPPDGAAGVLRTRADGACVFFDAEDGRRCAIQRALGHDALPSACQQFPRVSVIDDRGAHVTLSHYCPTVAAMLTADEGQAVEVVRLAEDDPARRRAEGFDARAAVPPFLRPGVAFDPTAYDAWERDLVRALGRPGSDTDTTLAAIAHAAEGLREWRPSRGALGGEVGRVLGALPDRGVQAAHGGSPTDYATMARLFDAVSSSVPEGLPRPALPPDWAAADAAWVAPAWRALSGPAGRFLAAKAFASSTAWLGNGVRTQIMGLAAARAVLRVEAARLAGAVRRPCDGATLVQAARAADALLEHLSDRPALVRRWAGVESLAPEAFLAGLGLGVPS